MVVSFWVTERSKLVHFVILMLNDLILGCMPWRYSVLYVVKSNNSLIYSDKSDSCDVSEGTSVDRVILNIFLSSF